jgi:ElaB/YqjD/DUF883 family membrane-anchored ribosome-binding protein
VPASPSEELESIRSELSAIAERVADLAIQSLREAISEGAKSRPPLERQLTRARNAIERANAILAGAEAVVEAESD